MHRMLVAPLNSPTATLASHVATLRQNQPVIIVSVDKTLVMLRNQIPAGPDLFFIDATGHHDGGVAFGPDFYNVGSPTLLEKITIVLRRVMGRFDSPRVIIHTANGVEAYNGRGATQEFFRSLAHFLRDQDIGMDVLVDDRMSKGAVKELRHLMDATVEEVSP